MDELTKGIIVFVFFNLITGLAMVFAILKARMEKANIILRILPYIFAEALFAFAFIYWFFTNMS